MKRKTVALKLTEKQTKAINNLFSWIVPHIDEYVETKEQKSIMQIHKKLRKVKEEFDFQRNSQRCEERWRNGGETFLSKIMEEAWKKDG